MGYKKTNIKITYENDEITFNVVYNNVKGIKKLDGSMSIDSRKMRRIGFNSTYRISIKMLEKNVTFPIRFIDQQWGSVDIIKNGDMYHFDYFDCDSYLDEFDEAVFFDGIQENTTFILNEKKYQEFLSHLKLIVDKATNDI